MALPRYISPGTPNEAVNRTVQELAKASSAPRLRRQRAVSARYRRMLSSRMVRLYEAVKKVASHLAPCDSLEVIWAYSQYLQCPNFILPYGIQVAPQFLAAFKPQTMIAEWTLEQIANEVIKYAEERPQQGRSLRVWGTLAQIANTLRDLEGEIYARLVGAKKIHLELIRIAHRQFIWQQQRFNWSIVIRYYKLFNTTHLNLLCRQATGLSVDQIYLIGMSYIGIFSDNSRAPEKINVEIPGLHQHHVSLFLRFASLSFIELRKKLLADHALDEDFAYRYSPLRQFPLVKVTHNALDEIVCPIPTLLFWRITTGLYYELVAKKDFANAFGDSFQSYVGDVLRARITNSEIKIIEEVEYHVGSNRKDTTDWIVQQGDDVALFVQCKTKRLTLESKTRLADLGAIDQDIRKLAGAVMQVYRSIVDYRNNRYPHMPFNKALDIYPVVVTLEDWYFFGKELPSRLESIVRDDIVRSDIPMAFLDEMPFLIMSVDEFEKVAGIIDKVSIKDFIANKISNSELKYWSFGSYCGDRYKEQLANLPPLFLDEYDAMFSELVA